MTSLGLNADDANIVVWQLLKGMPSSEIIQTAYAQAALCNDAVSLIVDAESQKTAKACKAAKDEMTACASAAAKVPAAKVPDAKFRPTRRRLIKRRQIKRQLPKWRLTKRRHARWRLLK